MANVNRELLFLLNDLFKVGNEPPLDESNATSVAIHNKWQEGNDKNQKFVQLIDYLIDQKVNSYHFISNKPIPIIDLKS